MHSAERRGALLALLLLLSTAALLRPSAKPAPTPSVPPPGAAIPGDPRLDLNRAGLAELDTLPGIGPVLAERIVAHREAHGPFESIEDLRAVRGIGARLFGRIQGSIRVGVSSPAPVGGAGTGSATDTAGAGPA